MGERSFWMPPIINLIIRISTFYLIFKRYLPPIQIICCVHNLQTEKFYELLTRMKFMEVFTSIWNYEFKDVFVRMNSSCICWKDRCQYFESFIDSKWNSDHFLDVGVRIIELNWESSNWVTSQTMITSSSSSGWLYW